MNTRRIFIVSRQEGVKNLLITNTIGYHIFPSEVREKVKTDGFNQKGKNYEMTGRFIDPEGIARTEDAIVDLIKLYPNNWLKLCKQNGSLKK